MFSNETVILIGLSNADNRKQHNYAKQILN